MLPQKGRLNAAAFHHPAIGGSVLLAERSIPRMRFTLARALGHLLANRDEAMVDLQEERKKTPTETFATAFASALLMPARGLRERFGAVHSEANEVSDIAILFLARTFGVTLKALRMRLEALKLVSPATLRRIDEAVRQAGSGARAGEVRRAAGAARPAALGDAARALRVPGHARLPQGADQPRAAWPSACAPRRTTPPCACCATWPASPS